MFIGIGTPLPDLASLPGTSRPGSGGGGIVLPQIDNDYYLQFDGIDDYFSISNPTIFTDFSLSFWYKKDSAVASYDTVVGKDTIDGGILTSIVFTSDKLYFKNRPGSWTALTTTTSSDTEFKYYSVTYNSTANELKGYCNGVLEVTTTPVFSGATGSEQSFDRIGRYNSGNYLDGFLDELAAFDYVLSPGDINAIYDATDIAGKKCADLSSMATQPVAWYRMGD